MPILDKTNKQLIAAQRERELVSVRDEPLSWLPYKKLSALKSYVHKQQRPDSTGCIYVFMYMKH